MVIDVSFGYLDGRVLDCIGSQKANWAKGDPPYFIGWEVVGKVVSIGEQVTRCKTGDSVIALLVEESEGCASRTLVQENSIVVKPIKLDSSCALSGIKRGVLAYDVVYYKMHAQQGDTALILNIDNPTSQIVMQLVIELGAFVVIGTRSQEDFQEASDKYASAKCKVVRLSDPSIDAEPETWKSRAVEELIDITDGLGFDHIFFPNDRASSSEASTGDLTARRMWQHVLFKCLAAHGHFVTDEDAFELDPSESWHLSLRGASLGVCFRIPMVSFIVSTKSFAACY